MPELTIDSHKAEFEAGNTVLDAARKLGIQIPTLCFKEGYKPSTSCMVCVAKVNGKLVPSCATMAEEGMVVESETDEVHEARRTALELLLSDHIGDCIAPCHRTCPAGMNIPLMIRQIASDHLRDAIITVKKDIPLPAVLGRICPAPCENACRRGSYDSPVSISLLKRHAADYDLKTESPYLPSPKPINGKKVAIVGAGPAGLTAAYYLLQDGYACTIFDDHENPGGMLLYGVPEDRLPRDVLAAEISLIEKLGVEFQMNTKVGEHLELWKSSIKFGLIPAYAGISKLVSIPHLQREYDAVLIASGDNSLINGIRIDRNTLQSSLKGVFVGGNATGRRSKMAVRSVADGKTAAISIAQYISGLPVTGPRKAFTVNIGKLNEGEIQRFLMGASESGQISPAEQAAGFSHDEALAESDRCLHCDCRKADNCRLRDYSGIYEANPNRYKSERKPFEQYIQHPDIIYEPGKCINCGLCIEITTEAREPLGFTFIGRGFNVRVGVPFSRSIAEGLQKVAAQCVAACPTGALAFKS